MKICGESVFHSEKQQVQRFRRGSFVDAFKDQEEAGSFKAMMQRCEHRSDFHAGYRAGKRA